MKKYALILSLAVGISMGQWVMAMPNAQKQCSANGVDYKMAVQFVKNLQKALKANDVNAFAEMGRYPVTINQSAGIHYTVKSVQDMTIRYYVIMTLPTKMAIEKQKPTDILCNAQGAATAKGEVWFTATPQGAQFFVINPSS